MKEQKFANAPEAFPDAAYRPQGGETDAPHALIVLEVVTFETTTLPLAPEGARIGDAIETTISDARMRGARLRSVRLELPPEFWDA